MRQVLCTEREISLSFIQLRVLGKVRTWTILYGLLELMQVLLQTDVGYGHITTENRCPVVSRTETPE